MKEFIKYDIAMIINPKITLENKDKLTQTIKGISDDIYITKIEEIGTKNLPIYYHKINKNYNKDNKGYYLIYNATIKDNHSEIIDKLYDLENKSKNIYHVIIVKCK